MKTLLKVALAIVGVALALFAAAFAWSHFSVEARLKQTFAVPTTEFDTRITDLALGERIVTVRNGCVDCHAHDLGGAAVVEDPAFAVVHAPNLTPHALASWTNGEILRAVRHGIGRDGRPLVLMPSHEYHHLSEEDLQAVVGYLRSIPAVPRPNGEIRLGPIAKLLTAAGQLPTMLPAEMIDHRAAFAVKPAEAATPAFGRYLVQSGCTGCHGPELRGGPIPGGPPAWPPASDISRDVAVQWSLEQFAGMLRTGVGSNGQTIKLPMPIELTSKLNDVEIEAMWRYLSGRE